MTRKSIPFLFFALLLTAACNQGVKPTADENAADTVLLAVATFETDAPSHVDQVVWIEGTVGHTCKHGGKRMFIFDEVDSIMVEITTGPDIVAFDESLVGSRVNVLGVLKEERIDEKYLNEWEAEVMKPEEENHEAGLHEGTKGHEDQPKDSKLAQINNLRNMLKESGKDHLSFYSIEAVSFEEIPAGIEEETINLE